jgi:branched-chain amino acid transport system substrate-binding protein
MRGLARRLPTIAVVGLAMALVAGCGSSLEEDQQGGGGDGPVKVGLLVPKSGVYAPLGRDMENGFRMYLDAKGGKLGGRTVQLVVADEGGGPESGVPAAQKLVQQDKVTAMVGVVNSAVALGVRDLVADAKVPLIVANAGANAITGEQRSDYVWRTSFTNGEVAGALGAYVAEQVGKGKVFLAAPDYAAGKEATAGFQETFEAAGGQVAGTELTPFGTTNNFQPYLARIQRSGAKAVYCFYAGAEAVTFVKQYQQFGLASKIPLYCSGFVTEGGVLAAQGDAALGIRTSLHYSDQIDNPTNQKFVADYSARYGAAPTVYAVQAYDAAAVLDQALAKGTTGDAVVEGLKGVGEIDSPRGPWRFNDGHGPDQTYYLRETRRQGGRIVNAVVQPLAGS